MSGQNEIVLTGEPRMKRASDRPSGRFAASGAGRILITQTGKLSPCVCAAVVFIGGICGVDGGVSSQFLTALLMTAPLALNTIIRVKGELVSNLTSICAKFNENWRGDNGPSLPTICREGRSTISGSLSGRGRCLVSVYFLRRRGNKGGTVKSDRNGRKSMRNIRFADISTRKMGDHYGVFIACTRGRKCA